MAAAAISDEALLEEVRRRGLAPAAPAAERVRSPGTRVRSPPSRVRSPDSRVSDPGPCLVEPGPRGGPLAPRLVSSEGRAQLFRLLETGGIRGSVEYSWQRIEEKADGAGEQAHAPSGHEQAHHQGHHERVARLTGSLAAHSLGRRCVHVSGLNGTEVFKLEDSAAAWNPAHVRWSFRILPPGCDDSADALFTVNRDVIGRGPLGLREQWRVFRGRARDDEVVYYLVCAAWGWDYHFYKSQADYDAEGEPVAQLTQAAGTGVRLGETGVWVPAEFDLSVGPGEDAGLLLAVATILDVAHERSQPPNPVV